MGDNPVKPGEGGERWLIIETKKNLPEKLKATVLINIEYKAGLNSASYRTTWHTPKGDHTTDWISLPPFMWKWLCSF